jgi:transposase-like protein
MFDRLPPGKAPPAKSAEQQLVAHVRDSRFANGLRCPRCGSEHVISWGKYRDRRRYRCGKCTRTFNALTDTPFAYSKRLDDWPQYLAMMRGQATLRAAASVLDLHLSTSFRWRHRVLGSKFLSLPEQLRGYVELREALFAYSEKGKRAIRGRQPERRGAYCDAVRWTGRRRVRVMLITARSGLTAGATLPGPVASQPDAERVLRGSLRSPATVITTAGRSSLYGAAAIRAGFDLLTAEHAALASDGMSHTENVRRMERRLRSWLRPFRGVATRYLDNYLAWHRFADPDDVSAWLHTFIGRIVPAAGAANNTCEHSLRSL